MTKGDPLDLIHKALERIEGKLDDYGSRITTIEVRCAHVQETKNTLRGILFGMIGIAISMVALVVESWK